MAKSVRTFIALPINPEIAPEAYDFLLTRRRQLLSGNWGQRVRWVDPEHFHLTLCFLGQTSTSEIPGLAERLKDELKTLASFSLTLNQPCLFPRPSRAKIVACPASHRSEFKQLVRRVDNACAPLLSQPEPTKASHSYRAHITLGRIRQKDSTKRPNFPSFHGEAALSVKRVDIIASMPSQETVQHEVLHSIEL